jgi:hypothetical protein
MILPEIGEMHWRDGWLFKRLEDGSVRIRKHAHTSDGNGAGIFQAVIPAAEWISLIQHLCGRQTPASFAEAQRFHGGA